MALVITVAIGKGGVGKTATTVNLAAAMALDNKKVLVVDTDIQSNSTYFLTGYKKDEKIFDNKGLFNMFRAYGMVETEKFVTTTKYDNIHLIASNVHTSLIPEQLSTLAKFNNEKETHFLRMALSEIADNYDYILIDTPPAYDNTIVLSSIVASDYVLLPIMFEEQCVDALQDTFAVFKKIEKEEDTKIEVLGILPTIVEKSATITKYYREVLHESVFGKFFFNTEIRKGNAVKESGNDGSPVIFYSKSSNPSKDYLALYAEIKEKLNAKGV